MHLLYVQVLNSIINNPGTTFQNTVNYNIKIYMLFSVQRCKGTKI